MRVKTVLLLVVFLVIAFFSLWYFRAIASYILIAAVLSIIGRPVMRFLQKIRMGRFYLPPAIRALITLLLISSVAGLGIALFIPLIADEAALLSEIDVNEITTNLTGPVSEWDEIMRKYNIFSDPEQSILMYMQQKVLALLNPENLTELLNFIIGFTGDLFIAVFSIAFITFFFLKEENIFRDVVFLITPQKHNRKLLSILQNTRYLLSRYFIGIIIQISLITLLVTVGLSIIGVHNAMLIGFFAGIINIIPYLGPMIGGLFGIGLTITSSVALGYDDPMLPLVLKVAGVFVLVQLMDNFIFQPVIFSTSVKAHPLEIFLVIMIAAKLAGIPGMILAVPAYTLFRVIAKEFLIGFRIVQKLTERL
jgi:predicted PurR-regulated permease PerM